MAKKRPEEKKVDKVDDAEQEQEDPKPQEDEGSRANTDGDAQDAATAEMGSFDAGEQDTSAHDDAPFEVGEWAGHKQWKCKLCAFDTLKGEDAMWDHLRERHMPDPEPAPTVLIADKSGKEKRS